MSWQTLSRERWTLPRIRSRIKRLKKLSATPSVRVENTVIREVEGKRFLRLNWSTGVSGRELVLARGDKTVEVETSRNARPLVEEKAAVR